MISYFPARHIICINCKSPVLLGDKLYKTGDKIRCSSCKAEMMIEGIFKEDH